MVASFDQTASRWALADTFLMAVMSFETFTGSALIGLPGKPVSAMVICDVFVRPVLAALRGSTEERRPGTRVRARAGRAIAAPKEREDHVRVALEARDGDLWAHPLPAKSGLRPSMVRADGIVVVPPGGRIAEGETVEVDLLEG